jgi:hypothetical protein
MSLDSPWIVVRTTLDIDAVKDFFSYCGQIDTIFRYNIDYFILFAYFDSLVTVRNLVSTEGIKHKGESMFIEVDPHVIIELFKNVPENYEQLNEKEQQQLHQLHEQKQPLNTDNNLQLAIPHPESPRGLHLSTAIAVTKTKLKELDESLLNIGPEVIEGASLFSDLSLHLIGKVQLSMQEFDTTHGISQYIGDHPRMKEASAFFSDVDTKLSVSENMSNLYTYLSNEAEDLKLKTVAEEERLNNVKLNSPRTLAIDSSTTASTVPNTSTQQ